MDSTDQKYSNDDGYLDRVLNLLHSEEWQLLSGTKHQDVVEKLNLLDRIGAPPMLVISADCLHKKGYIPRFDEGAAIDARSALGDNSSGTVLAFLSHRWLGGNHPDDEDGGTKYRALLHWSQWYETIYSKTRTRKLYFWIDWSCMDQDDSHNIDKGVKSLPLYVSVCNDFLCYQTPDYEGRAWCQVDRVIAYAFTFAGKILGSLTPSLRRLWLSALSINLAMLIAMGRKNNW